MTEAFHSDLRRLDAKATSFFQEVAAEFAKQKSDAEHNDPSAAAGVTLADAIDAWGGHLIGPLGTPRQRADAFAAHLMWHSQAPLLPGRSYVLTVGGQTVNAMVTELKYRLATETLEHLAAKELHVNDIGFVNISTAAPIGFDPYEENRDTGQFMLLDRHTQSAVATGMIRFGLRRAANTFFKHLR